MSSEDQENKRLVKEPIRVTIGQAAELYGVHPSTISNWTRAGLPVTREGRTGILDLAVALPWVRARDRRDLDEAKAATSPDVAKTAKIVAEARLKEMEVEEREGQLVPLDQTEERWTERVIMLREALASVPGAAVQTDLVAAEREAELEALIRDTLIHVVERSPKGETGGE